MKTYSAIATILLVMVGLGFAISEKRAASPAPAQEPAMTQEQLRIQHDAEDKARLEREQTRLPKSYLGAPGFMGYILLRVDPGSPADNGGLRAGDIILSVNNIQVHSIDDIQRVVQLEPGEDLKISFLRPAEGGLLPDAQRSATVSLAKWSAPSWYKPKQ